MGRLRVVTFKIPESELLKLDELVKAGHIRVAATP